MGFLHTKTKKASVVLTACTPGKIIPMQDIPDAVFSEGILGICIGIDPAAGEIHAPAAGKITQCTDTKHAITMETDSGAELLLHVGIDTVEMAGRGFEVFVKPGESVSSGQLLMTANLREIEEAGHPAVVVTAVTNSENFVSVTPLATETVQMGSPLLELQKLTKEHR